MDLDGQPAVVWCRCQEMGKLTQENIGKPMAVVYIEYKVVNGERVQHKEEVISIATICDSYNKPFQTTGLDNPQEARTSALLLRAGARRPSGNRRGANRRP